MKKIILLIIAAAGFVASASAQKMEAKKVAEPVRAKFTKLYPNVNEVSWELTRGHNFEANFTLKNAETMVVFDDLGNPLQTQTKIPSSLLPKSVMPYITMHYAGVAIKQAYKMESGGAVSYQVEPNANPKGIVRLIFDHYGNFQRNSFERADGK